MSSKPEAPQEAAPARAGDILQGGVIELVGPDAAAFAQAQLMNDVRLLEDLHWQWTGWLNPKGRVIALGALLRFAPDRFWLLLPDHPAATLCEALARMVFRSKVKLQARGDLASRSRDEPIDAAARGRRFGGDAAREHVVLDWGGERPRWLEVGPAPAVTPGDADEEAAWRVEDLAHGLPRLPGAAIAKWTPQMLGLARINAFSVKKGCYPGQEIVARTHFLGQAKRGLRRLQSPVPLVAGTALSGPDGELGEILCAASSRGRHEALAVLPLELADGELAADDATATPVRVTGFAEGLSR
jgi:folate-binding protein YgfZ